MKTIRFFAAALVVMMTAVSCGPDAEEMAKEYKTLAAELAQAKIGGDEKKAEKIMKEMEELNEDIAKAAEKEMKKTGKKIEKGAKMFK